MKICHFEDADALYVDLRDGALAETHDLDENTRVDADAAGWTLVFTTEHAMDRAELNNVDCELVKA